MRRLLERRTAEVEALSRIAQAALTAPGPDLLLRRVAEIAVEVFAADVAVIYIVDETRGELRPRAAVGLPADAEPTPIPLGAGVAATAIATREPVLIPDGAADDPRVVDPIVRREALRSLMVAPLVVAGAPIGVIEVALRILAVEDEPEVLDVLRAMLSTAGHRVFTAASGREALDLFDREPVDLVITDLGMPGMTGLALAAELKRRRAVPIALLTGWADELEPGTTPSVDLVVAKPFTREKRFEALARALPDRVRNI
jgi:CheY-like chemotaxis protein